MVGRDVKMWGVDWASFLYSLALSFTHLPCLQDVAPDDLNSTTWWNGAVVATST